MPLPLLNTPMKTIFLNNYLLRFMSAIILAFLFLSCKNVQTQVAQPAVQFEEIDFTIEAFNNDDTHVKYTFAAEGLDMLLDIDMETEACLLSVQAKNVLTDFNYFYDTDLESALEEIKILKHPDGNDIVILLPTLTEEFLAFQLLKFESQSGTFKNGFFEINTHEYSNVRNFYLDSKLVLVQRQDSFEISLKDFQY